MRKNKPELCKHWEKVAELDRTSRLEYVEIAGRIETLPAALRRPLRAWINRPRGEPIPESLGRSVRQGLTLLGRRKAAA
jgi:hypothetical protein